MRSTSDDRTSAARIRDEAMRLFAGHGVDAVSLRQIAGAAGVSAPLVVHHFGSKDGLKAAVDEHAVGVLRDMFDFADDPGIVRGDLDNATAVMVAALEREPALLAYLRRLLVDGGAQAEQLFRWLYDMTVAKLAEFAEHGAVSPSADPAVRAAFLLTNDLGAILLREQIRTVVGLDPLTTPGIERWSAVVMDAYAHGVLREPPQEETDA